MISSVGDVHDVDILAAAILHDTVEDVGVTKEELIEHFGEAVCNYVLEVTDDKSLEKAERKLKQIEHAPHLSAGARIIKLADKISNVSDVVLDPGENWTLERRREYVDWAEKVVAGLRGVNAPFESRFEALVAEARKSLA